MAAFWIAGVLLFMMELSAGLDYVEARLENLAPNFLDTVPAWGLAAWKLAEAMFWHSGQLEAGFRIVPLVTLPFALIGLAVAMKVFAGTKQQPDGE